MIDVTRVGTSNARSRPHGLKVGFAAGVASHGVASFAVMVIALVGARYLAASDFGAFASANVAWQIVLGAYRSLVGESTLVSDAEQGRRLRQVVGATTLIGLAVTAILLSAALLMNGAYRSAFVALALVAPSLLLLDGFRYLSFAELRPERALRIDIGWVSLQALAITMLLWTTTLTPFALVVAWGGTSAVGATALLLRARTVTPNAEWLRNNRSLSMNYFGEWLVGVGAFNVAALTLGVVAGGSSLGAFRAVQVLFGPLGVLYSGALVMVVPSLVDSPWVRRTRVMIGCSAGLIAIGILLTVTAAAVPDSIGSAVLGEVWPLARPLIVPVGLTATLGGAAAGAVAGLRSLRAASKAFYLRLLLAPLLFGMPVLAAVGYGAAGFAWGGAAQAAVAAVVWWRSYLAQKTSSAVH